MNARTVWTEKRRTRNGKLPDADTRRLDTPPPPSRWQTDSEAIRIAISTFDLLVDDEPVLSDVPDLRQR